MLALEKKLLYSTALFSDDDHRKYRYILTRCWDIGRFKLVWVMLNPSKADENRNDATIRRCMGFASAWGYGGIEVYNLFAYVSTYPEMLMKVKNPVGPKNDDVLKNIPRDRDVMVAWGNVNPAFSERITKVQSLLNRNLFCMGCTKLGNPKHPVRLASSTQLTLWRKV